MKKPEKGKKKKIIGYNYLGMVGIVVIALVLLGSLMVQSKGLQQRLDYYNSKAAALEKSIDSEKERTKEIEAQKEYMKTDEYVEEAAREKLGLVKDNEISGRKIAETRSLLAENFLGLSCGFDTYFRIPPL